MTCSHGLKPGRHAANPTWRFWVRLPDTAPDVEGSIASALVTIPASQTGDGKPFNSTCFYVSAPWSKDRSGLQIVCHLKPEMLINARAPAACSRGPLLILT